MMRENRLISSLRNTLYLLLCLLVALSIAATPSHAQSPSDFETTLRAAEQGDANAQLRLGLSYTIGQDVPQDDKKAVYWFTKAAEQGNAGAQYMLGVMYNSGTGVLQDYKKAVYWTTKAAEQGDANAQLRLGLSYTLGQGNPQDYKKAASWYTKAAEQGNAGAQGMLGSCYIEGQGVPQDDKKAVYWTTKAAEQGNSDAQLNLGVMYSDGRGTRQDFKQAYVWLSLSAISGESSTVNFRDELARKLTPKALAEAKVLAAQYQKKIDSKTNEPPAQIQSKDPVQAKTLKWLGTATKEEKYKFWTKLASEANKFLPMNVDEEIIALNVTPQANGLSYNYKNINNQYADMTKHDRDEVLLNVGNTLMNRFCTSPDSRLLRESNASMTYNYYDLNDKFIGRVSFEAGKDCAKRLSLF